MKKYFIILLFISTKLYAIDSYKIGDTLYVWASNGIIVRNNPEQNSNVLGYLNYGAKVICLENKYKFEYNSFPILELDVNHNSIEDSNDFSLNGRWLKINYGNSEGYIFDGYLSPLLPATNKSLLLEYFQRIYDTITIIKERQYFEAIECQVLLEKGILIDQFDNWGEGFSIHHTYHLPISMDEAFLLLSHLFIDSSPGYYTMNKSYDGDKLTMKTDLGEISITKFLNYVVIYEWSIN
ncbi:MAG: SH3 domain-containing protein [Bacteroidales bacterium]|nr:SH3 domain-containing protein [Bacteroidales bacterium]